MTAIAALDYEGTSRRIATRNYQLHYHEAGEGPVLVMLHGSGPGVSAWSNFRGNLPTFARHFRTILLDMPGFGRSELPPLDRLYPEIAAEATREFLDALGIEKASLLGNSMGGYAVAEFALAYPQRVDRLVLMGPAGLAVSTFNPTHSEGSHRLADFLADPSRASMVSWVETMVSDIACVDDELIDERTRNALAPGVIDNTLSIFATFGQFPAERPPWTRASQITAPTLITWGRDDNMLRVEGAFLSFAQMPDVELHLFGRCGHWAQVERKPEFERLVVEFLTREHLSR
jgi:4,5:9,10-diseco-3-hydroxy-5,9,17-trioxoandrosta-1(10),2-diene-4-oate hydrolase